MRLMYSMCNFATLINEKSAWMVRFIPLVGEGIGESKTPRWRKNKLGKNIK